MGNVLISTLGLAPGVVTTAVYLLNQKPETRVERVAILYPETSELVQGVDRVLKPEFETGGRLQGVTLDRQPMRGVYDDHLSQVEDIEAFLGHFTKTLLELRKAPETERLFVSISGGRKSMTYAVSWGLQLSLPAVVVDGVWHVQIPREGPEYTFQALRPLPSAMRRDYLYPPDAVLVPLPYQVGKPDQEGLPVRDTLHPSAAPRRIARLMMWDGCGKALGE